MTLVKDISACLNLTGTLLGLLLSNSEVELTSGSEARMSSVWGPQTLLANSRMLSSSSAEGMSRAMLLCLNPSKSLMSLCPLCVQIEAKCWPMV